MSTKNKIPFLQQICKTCNRAHAFCYCNPWADPWMIAKRILNSDMLESGGVFFEFDEPMIKNAANEK